MNGFLIGIYFRKKQIHPKFFKREYRLTNSQSVLQTKMSCFADSFIIPNNSDSHMCILIWNQLIHTFEDWFSSCLLLASTLPTYQNVWWLQKAFSCVLVVVKKQVWQSILWYWSEYPRFWLKESSKLHFKRICQLYIS